ncbi:MAG TPA: adenosylcobinamide-GDP ribazoletransferase [Azospirillaceae bacterium]|nr:adenosylcobinamide-GDP ribazoletransferase [Azospirillaceae bacterium]
MFTSLTAAIVFLTRLPLRLPGRLPDDIHARAMGWYAVVGAGIGLAGGIVFWFAGVLDQPPLVRGLLTVTALAFLTGALHEDGLADIADGFGGGRDKARKLEIMRDSRVGSYGVLAIVLSVGLRAALLAQLEDPGEVMAALVVAETLSRAALPALAHRLPPARTDGLGRSHGATTGGVVLACLITAAVITVFAAGVNTLAVLSLAILLTGGMGLLATRQVGGYTGDVLGATQQVVATGILILLVGMQ